MIFIRRVLGQSMAPALDAGRIVVGTRLIGKLKVGDVVVVRHEGLEKIKRISRINSDAVFVLGDNLAESIDSRYFGWLSRQLVVGKVVGRYPNLV